MGCVCVIECQCERVYSKNENDMRGKEQENAKYRERGIAKKTKTKKQNEKKERALTLHSYFSSHGEEGYPDHCHQLLCFRTQEDPKSCLFIFIRTVKVAKQARQERKVK